MTLIGPLPIVDAGRVLQEESMRALQAALPPREFIFRQEGVDDYGVDGSLELTVNGKATNIRAQLQLKARTNTQPNADGVVPISISTANLNYLLNGICPFYVLYRPELSELRFAFAREEWSRLERENPKWRDQQSVTLHFHRTLTAESLEELRVRVMEEAAVRRAIDERLNSLQRSAAQIVISADSLLVTDSNEALEMLGKFGQTLVSVGLAKAVIDRARLIPTHTLLAAPRAALCVAYAHFHLAHYYDASAALRQLLATRPNLDENDRSFLNFLFISVKRMLREIDQEQYDNEMSAWRSTAPLQLAVQYDISCAWSSYADALAKARPEGERSDALGTLRDVLDRGRSMGGAANLYNIELLELTLRHHEVEDRALDALAIQDMAARGTGDPHHARMLNREAQSDTAHWFAQVRDLAERTRVTAPNMHAEFRLLHAHALLAQATRAHLHARAGYGQPPSKEQVNAIFVEIDEMLRFARILQNRELELSAMLELARAMDVFDRQESATVLAKEALEIADLSGCAIQARQLRAFLGGEDRADVRLRQLKEVASESEEAILRRATDDQLFMMASLTATAKQLPKHRVPNILRSLRAQRQLALERRDWCKHIMLAEFQRHDDSPITMYSESPIFKVVCMHLRYEALVHEDDVLQMSAEFRRKYCDGCSHRRPDASLAPGVRAARNRAKAARRRQRGKR